MTKKSLRYFEIARSVSKLSNFKTTSKHIGCIVVCDNRVISSGYNSNKTSPLQKKYNKLRFDFDSTPHTLHAETAALKPLLGRYDIDFKSVKLYIYRETADGSKGLAKPCESCMALIKNLGIREINYTSDDGYCFEEIK